MNQYSGNHNLFIYFIKKYNGVVHYYLNKKTKLLPISGTDMKVHSHIDTYSLFKYKYYPLKFNIHTHNIKYLYYHYACYFSRVFNCNKSKFNFILKKKASYLFFFFLKKKTRLNLLFNLCFAFIPLFC